MNSSGDDNDSAEQTSSSYVSCIKINGRPILPPLMTEKKRVQMRRYRELAIALEGCLLKKRDEHENETSETSSTATFVIKRGSISNNDGSSSSNSSQSLDDENEDDSDERSEGEVVVPSDANDLHLENLLDTDLAKDEVALPTDEKNLHEENLDTYIAIAEDGVVIPSQSDENDLHLRNLDTFDTYITKDEDVLPSDEDDLHLENLDTNIAKDEVVLSSDDEDLHLENLDTYIAKENELNGNDVREISEEELDLCSKRKRPVLYFDEIDNIYQNTENDDTENDNTDNDYTDIETKSVMSNSTCTTTTSTTTIAELDVGLFKLQAKMKLLSPKYLTMGGDPRSPLLKGVSFPNYMNRSHGPVRVPAKALDPAMKPKFCRVTACVRGYLTRRLLHTDKIQTIIQTIRDTVDFVLKLYKENPNDPTQHLQLRPEDMNLHRLLIQQLNGACSSFHGIFFKLTPAERMAIIATDRQKLKAKVLKVQQQSKNGSNGQSSNSQRSMSSATLKAIQRRLSFGTNVPQLQLHLHQSKTKTPKFRSQPKFLIPSSAPPRTIASRNTVTSRNSVTSRKSKGLKDQTFEIPIVVSSNSQRNVFPTSSSALKMVQRRSSFTKIGRPSGRKSMCRLPSKPWK